jgi:hypothetical protein
LPHSKLSQEQKIQYVLKKRIELLVQIYDFSTAGNLNLPDFNERKEAPDRTFGAELPAGSRVFEERRSVHDDFVGPTKLELAEERKVGSNVAGAVVDLPL